MTVADFCKTIGCCLLILSSAGTISAQEETVLFEFRPLDAVLRIEGDTTLYDFSKIPQPFKLDLPRGKHLLELWAPGYEVLTDTIEVKKASKYHANIYRKKLHIHTPEYLAYDQKRRYYGEKKFLRTGGTYALLAADIFLPIYTFIGGGTKELKAQRDELNTIQAQYNHSINAEELADLKAKYNGLLPTYDDGRKKHNRKVIIGSSLTVLAVGTTIFHLWRVKNKPLGEKPQFTPGQPFSFHIKENQFGGQEIGLTLNF